MVGTVPKAPLRVYPLRRQFRNLQECARKANVFAAAQTQGSGGKKEQKLRELWREEQK